MGSNCLSLACALKHEELGEDSNGLKPDGKGPQDLGEGESVVENEGEDEAGSEEVFNFECVDGGVMRGSVFELHKVEDVAAAGDEEQLHDGIVDRYIAEEQVEIACQKDPHVETLCFERYAST